MKPTILIVGASSGIGKETALIFSKNSWKVIACARNVKKLNDLSKLSIKKNNKNILTSKLDVTHSSMLNENINKIIKKFGIPDIVFLNAGTNNPNTKDIVNYNETKKLFDTNFFGIINCIDIILPKLKKNNNTQLVIMSSVAGYRGLPYAAAYCSSKSALISYAESIYNQCKKIGIRVRVICPGFVKTPLTDKNEFKMPMIISSEKAGKIIYKKLTSTNDFEIIFPKLFCFLMKFLSYLPNFIYFRITARLLK